MECIISVCVCVCVCVCVYIYIYIEYVCYWMCLVHMHLYFCWNVCMSVHCVFFYVYYVLCKFVWPLACDLQAYECVKECWCMCLLRVSVCVCVCWESGSCWGSRKPYPGSPGFLFPWRKLLGLRLLRDYGPVLLHWEHSVYSSRAGWEGLYQQSTPLIPASVADKDALLHFSALSERSDLSSLSPSPHKSKHAMRRKLLPEQRCSAFGTYLPYRELIKTLQYVTIITSCIYSMRSIDWSFCLYPTPVKKSNTFHNFTCYLLFL